MGLKNFLKLGQLTGTEQPDSQSTNYQSLDLDETNLEVVVYHPSHTSLCQKMFQRHKYSPWLDSKTNNPKIAVPNFVRVSRIVACFTHFSQVLFILIIQCYFLIRIQIANK